MRSNRQAGGRGAGRRRLDARSREEGRSSRGGGDQARRGVGDGGVTVGRDGRPRKTQQELDAEMEDYWGSTAGNEGVAGTETTLEPINGANEQRTENELDEDVMMIE